jgi:hypothetical protein
MSDIERVSRPGGTFILEISKREEKDYKAEEFESVS